MNLILKWKYWLYLWCF